MDDAAVFDALLSPGVPSAGTSTSSESAASPMVAATSIGMFSRLVSSHSRAKSKEINCGDVSDVSKEGSIQLPKKDQMASLMSKWKLLST